MNLQNNFIRINTILILRFRLLLKLVNAQQMTINFTNNNLKRKNNLVGRL